MSATGSRVLSLLGLALLAILPTVSSQHLAAQEARAAEESSLPKGVVVERVPCGADPQQSYALFLPSSYSPDRPAPIVYAFDPGARGSLPVELMKDAAERHGYIVVGSNNSRNGPAESQKEAAQAVWQDTHQRFAIDSQRVYFTGFSGGARVATSLALTCNCAAGVISHGAGFPTARGPEEPIPFSYFGTAGHLDFNYPEVVEVAASLEANGSTNRLRRFQGTHQWAPAEVWEEAFLWMELQARKQEPDSPDEEFVRRQFARAAKRAKEMDEAGDVHGAVYQYKKLVQDFAGLADTREFERRAEELEATKAFRRAQEREQVEIKRQRRLAGEFLFYLDVLRTDPANRQEALYQLRRMVGGWKRRLDKNKVQNEEDVVLRRTLHGMFVSTFEDGLQALRDNEPVIAAGHFEIASEIASTSPMPLFHLARAHALDGNTKGALRALRKAVEKGFSYPELLREAREFASLQEKKEFRDILASLKQQSPPQP